MPNFDFDSDSDSAKNKIHDWLKSTKESLKNILENTKIILNSIIKELVK